MSRSVSRLKATYYKNKKKATELLEGYRDFVDEQERKVLLNLISDSESDSNIFDYQDQLFYYEFAAWEYEIREALRDFLKTRKDFTGYDKAGTIIEEINRTHPRKKKVNYKESETVSKATRKIAEYAYTILVTRSKMVPIHLSEKRKFPLPTGDQTDGPQE